MGTTKRFVVLDAFRGLAALLVFLYHLKGLTFISANTFVKNSGVFVDLFFVLSGFVIYHNYKNKIYNLISGKTFMLKRALRLVPLHIYTLLVMLLLEIFKFLTYNYLPYTKAPFSLNTMDSFWVQLLLLNSIIHDGFNWNFPNWSISAEMIAYLVFVITSLIWVKKKQLSLWLAVSIVLLGYLFFYIKQGDFNIKANYNFSFIRGLIGFFFGIVIYKLKTTIQVTNYNNKVLVFSVLELFAITILIVTILNIYSVLPYFFVLHLVFGSLILIFAFEGGFISKFLHQKAFQKLGLWSYSIYLNHVFVIVVFNMLLKFVEKKSNLLPFLELVVIAVVIGYSALTYKYIEKRFYKRTN